MLRLALPFETVIVRRTISLWLIFALLVSIVVPVAAGPSSCGEAARSEERASTSRKGHGCHGCNSKSVRPAEVADGGIRLIGADILQLGNERPKTASFCCHEGQNTERVSVQVGATAARFDIDFETHARSIAHLIADVVQSSRRTPLPSIDGSPPHLAAVSQHTYLQISSLLI
jgi:hypothetical protein